MNKELIDNLQILEDYYTILWKKDKISKDNFRRMAYSKAIKTIEKLEAMEQQGEDIGPNGTVQSLRLANAQIAYRGSGDLASASKPGWGTNALMKFWPF